MNGAQDANAILFKDGNATFYLDYQNKGVGYQIGKYGFTFNVSLPQDEWVNVTLTSTYVHGSTATTVLKVNGNVYSPSLIVHPSSVSAHSSTSYLGTSEMFTNINGYLDNVVIGNKYNQSLTGAIQYEFEGEGYKPLIDYSGWRVAIVNSSERLRDNKIRKIESSLRDIEVDVALFFSTDIISAIS